MSREWLDLREPVDATARSVELAGHLAARPPTSGSWRIHDLACGTGAMGRWLAPLLPGPQHWVLHDHDPGLLEVAAAETPTRAADGAAVTVGTRRSDITLLGAADFAGATLVTASALLDILTAEELNRLIGVCGEVGCPILLTLSVVGQVKLTPAEPLDHDMTTAFNDHQRRTTQGRRLLGPDAVAAAVAGFRAKGVATQVRPSHWQLGPDAAGLTAEWLSGWVRAAVEQRAELASAADVYLARRLAQLRAGELTVTLEHADILAGVQRGRP